MVVGDIAAEVEFLRAVFHALGDLHAGCPAEIRIGDSLVMVSPAGERDCSQRFCTSMSTTPTARIGGRLLPER